MRRFRPLDQFILHPFLWAIYPPLALLSTNIDQIAPGMAVRSLLVSIFLAGGVLLLAWMLLRDWSRAAVFTSAFMIAFFSYGHVYRLVEYEQIFGIMVGRHRFLLPLYLLILGGVLAAVWKPTNLRTATQAFNLIGLVMVLLPGYQITSYSLHSYNALRQLSKGTFSQDVVDIQVPEGQIPADIYYIILDMYTRQDVLEELFGYDNEPFLQALEARGFYIAGCSQSNYATTTLSLTSSLNMEYLPDLDEKFSPPNTNDRELYPFLWNNRVIRALQEAGYRFLAFDSGYSPTDFHNADVFYSQETDLLGILLMDGINPYEVMILSTSGGMFVYELNASLPEAVQKFLSFETSYIIHRNRILYTLNRLERLGDVAGPKFVYAHILSPHPPFVFGPDGIYIERKTPFTLNDDQDIILLENFIPGYRDQIIYLNQRILAAVDSILAESAQSPVILIQGDHGVPRFSEHRNAILNAYYLPGAGSSLYESISPVNSFRVIFNQYFDARLELLPDEACASTTQAPYECMLLVNPNPACTTP